MGCIRSASLICRRVHRPRQVRPLATTQFPPNPGPKSGKTGRRLESAAAGRGNTMSESRLSPRRSEPPRPIGIPHRIPRRGPFSETPGRRVIHWEAVFHRYADRQIGRSNIRAPKDEPPSIAGPRWAILGADARQVVRRRSSTIGRLPCHRRQAIRHQSRPRTSRRATTTDGTGWSRACWSR